VLDERQTGKLSSFRLWFLHNFVVFIKYGQINSFYICETAVGKQNCNTFCII